MKACVIGDAMIDKWHVGSISRLNPESSHVLLGKETDLITQPGGAANVAANLERLAPDDVVIRLFQPESDQCVKHRYVVDGHQLLRWDEERRTSRQSARLLADELSCIIHSVDLVIVSDYDKGSIEVDLLTDMLRRWKKERQTSWLLVDTKRSPGPWIESAADYFFPNKLEYREYAVLYDSASVIRKYGQHGAVLCTKSYSHHVSAPTIDHVSSVVGAGDTFIAAAAAFIMANSGRFDPKQLTEFAVDAASLAVTFPYTATPALADVEDFRRKHGRTK